MLTLKLFLIGSKDLACAESHLSEVSLTHTGVLKDYTEFLGVLPSIAKTL